MLPLAAAGSMEWTAELSAAVAFVLQSLVVLLYYTHWTAELSAAVFLKHACVGSALAPSLFLCSYEAILHCIHL